MSLTAVPAYSAATGDPLAGLTPTWSIFYTLGTGAGAGPAITGLGGGLYSFTTPADNQVGIIDFGATASPRYMFIGATASDATDQIEALYKIGTGRWKIDTTANQLYLYDDDDTTVLFTFNLKNASGSATSTSIFERVPV